MANFKRGRTRRNVRCTLCTPNRWRGNHQGRLKAKDEAAGRAAKKEIEGWQALS